MRRAAPPLDPAPTVGLIGLGRIGTVLLAALRRFAPEARVIVAGRDPARLAAAVSAWPGVEIFELENLATEAEMVVPCLQPDAYRGSILALARHMRADAILVSVTNAVPLEEIGRWCARPVVKAIPSPAHAAGRGICLVTPGPGTGPDEVERVCALFRRFCRPVLTDPADGRVASNLAGSAPAVLAAFCSAFLKANAARARAVAPPDLRAMMTESVSALAAVLEEGASFEDVVARTATPGGMTEAAIAALNAEAPALCGRMVDATFRREAELLASPPPIPEEPRAGAAPGPSDIPSGESRCP